MLPLGAQVPDPLAKDAPILSGDSDLASKAAVENLPQVSAAVLRVRIQEEKEAEKRRDLTRRLVILLVTGGRFSEALSVVSTVDPAADPSLAYWKAAALLGDGDYAGAKNSFESLIKQKSPLPGITQEQLLLGLARALRGSNDQGAALEVLDRISRESAVSGEVVLERGADLLALGRSEECLRLLQSFSPTTPENKAMAAYLKALLAWHGGDWKTARKLFAAVPAVTPWTDSAATFGEALCLSSSGKPELGIDLLEKHLDHLDSAPLMEEQFRLLDQLHASSAIPESAFLKKWSEDAKHPVRGRLAAFYRAKGELRLGHVDKAEILLELFLRNHPDDSLGEKASLLLASSKLQQGKPAEALTLVEDRPSATPAMRAKFAYLRGLAFFSAGKPRDSMAALESAADLDPTLSKDALFNKAVVIATTDKGSLDVSKNARSLVELNEGSASGEMNFQIALDLVRRADPSGLALLSQVAETSSDPALKSRARLAAAEWNMKSGKGDAANRDLAKSIRENSGEPEREEYLEVFLKDTGRKSDTPGVIAAARAFLSAHPESRFVPEVRLKLAEAQLNSGDVQGARVEFEQLAFSGADTDFGRRALFLAAQAAARAMDPASIDDSLMLLERVSETGSNDQLVWQARLQQGALKNAQNLPLEALSIYDKILSYNGEAGPDAELRAAVLMAKADTHHLLGSRDKAQEMQAVEAWRRIADDPLMPLRWRNQALCKSGIILEKAGDSDAALAAYYAAFRNPRTVETEQLWHDKAAFEAARLLESRKQWNDAVNLYARIMTEGGPRDWEAKARLAKLRLENFLWEN